MNSLNLNIDKSWTLFLDRDGVVNRLIEGGYVTSWDEFEILPGVLESIATLSEKFGRIVVITNQQGIGKGLMSEDDLAEIHLRFLAEVDKAGGRIDRIFHCPHLADEGCPCRKPRTGMVLDAQMAFLGIDLDRSVLIGDSPTDIELGKDMGMFTVGVGDKTPDAEVQVNSLHDLAAAL